MSMLRIPDPFASSWPVHDTENEVSFVFAGRVFTRLEGTPESMVLTAVLVSMGSLTSKTIDAELPEL